MVVDIKEKFESGARFYSREEVSFLISELEELKKLITLDHNIIILKEMPDWARTAMKEGRFISAALLEVKRLENALEEQKGLS